MASTHPISSVSGSYERYRTLLEINNAIITNLTQEDLFSAICGVLRRVVPVHRAALTLYDEKSDIVRILALSTEWISEEFRVGFSRRREDSSSNRAISSGRPVICRDIAARLDFPIDRMLAKEGIQSYCIVPMILEGKCIGTLNVAGDSKDQFSETDAEFLQQVASQVALAIGNMNSYQESARLKLSMEHTAERYRTLLEINNAIITSLNQKDLLHTISVALRRVIPFDRAAFTLYDLEKDVFRFLAIEGTTVSPHFRAGMEFQREESISAWVFDNQRPSIKRELEKEATYSNDHQLVTEGLKSYCVVPLTVGGKAIGTLNLASEKIAQYSEADAQFLCELAAQVALAVSNMTVYEEIHGLKTKVENTAARYRTLLETNNAIVTHLTPEELLRSVSRTLKGIIPFSGAAVTLYNPDTDNFRYFAMEGRVVSDYLRVGTEFSRKQTISAWVFDNQRAATRGDLRKEQQYPNDARLVAQGIVCDCVVPLIFGGKSIGTLNIGHTEPSQYSEADLELLQEIANQVALAVVNMQAFEKIVELKARVEKENVYLQEEIRTEHNFEEIVGNSPPLLAALHKVEQVAPTDSTVLIYGETGTGKELIARAIHDRSSRKNRPLVKVNCSAISAGLVESELFGHVKGAFTGAFEKRVGRFELADGGTIFLDEIGELPLDTQVKLLRVLQEREFEAVGSNKALRVDVRVIAATNRDLQEAIRLGTFRSDLFYRLNVFPIDMPPLRDRRSDISQLAMFFLARFSKKFGKNIQGISRETAECLANYPWPGNIREMQNVIERAVILSQSSVLELNPGLIPLPEPSRSVRDSGNQEVAPAPAHLAGTLEEMERAHIVSVLSQTRGVVEGPSGAAKILGLHPNTLRHRMQKLGIKRAAHRES